MKILVTGANGFIGKSLASMLIRGNTVVGQVRQVSKKIIGVHEYFDISIDGQSDWRSCLKKVDAVVHLAAVAHNNSNDQNYIKEVNVKGTINLANQAAKSGVKRFVFISSIGVLGGATLTPFDENSSVEPHSAYAESKLQAERALLKIADESELEVVIIRPVLVYGVGAPGNFAKLVKLVQKMPVLPFALCRNKRSFISVDNLVSFISICIEHPRAANETFCISDGRDFSIREFTDGVATGLNKNLVQLPIPVAVFNFLGKITGKSQIVEQLIGDLQVDSSKAKKLLCWSPPVTLAQTLSKLSNNK